MKNGCKWSWERGGGITEQAHIKLLRTLTSERPALQKGFFGCQLNTVHTEQWAPFTLSLSQGDLDVFEKVYKGKSGQRIMQTSAS